MKVYIGPYRNSWACQVHYDYMNKKYGYHWPEYGKKGLLNKVEPFRETFLERLEDTLQWVYNHSINLYLNSRERKQSIRIDRYDTWSMDDTLALIIAPMLRQLKETKHGSPLVADEDVPESIRSTSAPPLENEYDTDDFHHDRWDWVLNEMIWAFEQKVKDDWESDYYEHHVLSPDEKNYDGFFGGSKLVCKDPKGLKAHQARITRGFHLFGKYYESLWD